MLINQTPARTCKNFKINDFEYDSEISNDVKEFDNVKVTR